jgi:hypothetical protein
MNEEWLVDGRKIPDKVMGYIRKIAVQAVRENGQSPELVAIARHPIHLDECLLIINGSISTPRPRPGKKEVLNPLRSIGDSPPKMLG